MAQVEQRRICWPKPDATCLEGGCGYCNDEPFRDVAQIRRYAERAGVIPNRAQGEQDALRAFTYGHQRGWNNAQWRVIKRSEEGK